MGEICGNLEKTKEENIHTPHKAMCKAVFKLKILNIISSFVNDRKLKVARLSTVDCIVIVYLYTVVVLSAQIVYIIIQIQGIFIF